MIALKYRLIISIIVIIVGISYIGYTWYGDIQYRDGCTAECTKLTMNYTQSDARGDVCLCKLNRTGDYYELLHPQNLIMYYNSTSDKYIEVPKIGALPDLNTLPVNTTIDFGTLGGP